MTETSAGVTTERRAEIRYRFVTITRVLGIDNACELMDMHNELLATIDAQSAEIERLRACAYKLDEIIHSGSCNIYPFHDAEARELLAVAGIGLVPSPPRPAAPRGRVHEKTPVDS